jgi:hypothetical protein
MTCAYQKLYPAALVIAAANDRPRNDLVGPLDRAMVGRVVVAHTFVGASNHRPIQRFGHIAAQPILGGLLHHYCRI